LSLVDDAAAAVFAGWNVVAVAATAGDAAGPHAAHLSALHLLPQIDDELLA
jgi:hypothetical protein